MADDGTLRETHDSALGDTSGPVTSEAARVHSPYIEQEGQNRSTARLGARYEGGVPPISSWQTRADKRSLTKFSACRMR